MGLNPSLGAVLPTLSTLTGERCILAYIWGCNNTANPARVWLPPVMAEIWSDITLRNVMAYG
jgi:hypothetical protein